MEIANEISLLPSILEVSTYDEDQPKENMYVTVTCFFLGAIVDTVNTAIYVDSCSKEKSSDVVDIEYMQYREHWDIMQYRKVNSVSDKSNVILI